MKTKIEELEEWINQYTHPKDDGLIPVINGERVLPISSILKKLQSLKSSPQEGVKDKEGLRKEYEEKKSSVWYNPNSNYAEWLEQKLIDQFTRQTFVTDEDIDEMAIKWANKNCEPTNGDLTYETEIYSEGIKQGLQMQKQEEWISDECNHDWQEESRQGNDFIRCIKCDDKYWKLSTKPVSQSGNFIVHGNEWDGYGIKYGNEIVVETGRVANLDLAKLMVENANKLAAIIERENDFYCQDEYYDKKDKCKRQCVTCFGKD